MLAWGLVVGIVALVAFWRKDGVPLVSRVTGKSELKGVHPALVQLMSDWETYGGFNIKIAPGGGLRTSLADTEFPSNAANLSQTPHGRGAGLDVWPEGFEPYTLLSQQPEAMQRFKIFGEFAEQRGLTWGGRWNVKFTDAQRDGIDPPGDWPHIEIPNWRDLPYPPPAYGA